MSVLRNDQAAKVLDIILDHLAKKGLLVGVDREKVKELLLDNLSNHGIELKHEHLKDPVFYKKLVTAIFATIAQQKDPNYKFNFELLFKDKKDLTPEEQQLLKEEIKKMLKKYNELEPDPSKRLDEKSLDLVAEEILKRVLEDKDELGLNPSLPKPKPGLQQEVLMDEEGNAIGISLGSAAKSPSESILTITELLSLGAIPDEQAEQLEAQGIETYSANNPKPQPTIWEEIINTIADDDDLSRDRTPRPKPPIGHH